MRSCHFILDGNPAGLISSVSLFGCLRMQGRLIFSVSSTDVEIEIKNQSQSFRRPEFPNPRPKKPIFKKTESHILKFGKEKIPDSPTSGPKKSQFRKRKPKFENRKPSFWKLRGDGGAQSDSANPAGLISFVSFSTHSVCNMYCPREFVSCTAHTNTYGGLDMQTGKFEGT